MKFFRKKPTTPPQEPKPMVAKFTVHMRNGTDLSYSENYDAAKPWSKPEPHMWDGWVRVGDKWVNREDIAYIDAKYEEVRDEVRDVM